MDDRSITRRTVLLTTGAALGTAALGGCLGGDGSDAPGGGAGPIGTVPSGADGAFYADVEALLGDDSLRGQVNDVLAAADASVQSFDEVLEQGRTASGLDPRELQSVTLFYGYEPNEPAGMHVRAGWAESTVREAVSQGRSEAESDTYEGHQLYHTADSTLGVVDDGHYVLGVQGGAQAAIDVATGAADPVGGQVRDAFGAAPDGPIRVGFVAPEALGAEPEQSDSPIDPSVVTAVTHGYGGYVQDGDERRASLTLETIGADPASGLAEQLRAAIELARREVSPGPTTTPELVEMTDGVLSSIEVVADGSTVTLSTDRGEAVPVVALGVVGSFVLGLGGQQPVAPQVMFDFEYDADAGLLTVTHTAGDHVPVSELYVRGQGLTSAPGADMDGAGQWAGTTSGSVSGGPAVGAGDSVTVGVEADYVVRLVWIAADEPVSSTLAQHQGPAN